MLEFIGLAAIGFVGFVLWNGGRIKKRRIRYLEVASVLSDEEALLACEYALMQAARIKENAHQTQVTGDFLQPRFNEIAAALVYRCTLNRVGAVLPAENAWRECLTTLNNATKESTGDPVEWMTISGAFRDRYEINSPELGGNEQDKASEVLLQMRRLS